MARPLSAAVCAAALGACAGEWRFTDDAGSGCPAGGCPFGLVCAGELGRCVECADASHCPLARPRCDAPRGACVECTASADCEAGSVCDALETRTCVPLCSPDAGCAVGRCTALPLGQVCDACWQDDVCERLPATRRCDPSRRACVRCFEDGHCAQPVPRCDRRLGTCAECIDSRDCGAGRYCAGGVCRAP